MHRRVDHDGVSDEVAVEEPLEIRVDGRAAGGDDAHARQRRRAGARVPPRRGPDRRGRAPPGRPPISPPTRSRSAGPLRRDPGRAQLLHDAPRAGSAARARSRRSQSTRRWRARARRSPARLLAALPERLPQPAFELHRRPARDRAVRRRRRSLLLVREDVGRHNAMDKVIGAGALSMVLCRRTGLILCVSGQVGFLARPEGGRRRAPDPGRRRGAETSGHGILARDRERRAPRLRP